MNHTFAVDEAGDVSFRFDRGASRYFVVALIGTANLDQLRRTCIDSAAFAQFDRAVKR